MARASNAGIASPTETERRLESENAELRARLQELEDTLQAIHSGDVDALVVNNDIYTLESAHAASNRLRQDVLAQMADAVFAFDTEGHLIYLNAAAEQRYGLVASEALGRRRAELFDEVPEAISPATEADGAAPGRFAVLSRHRLPDGRSFHVESTLSALSHADGAAFGGLLVVRDVTQRRMAEQRRQALAHLAERTRDLERADDIGFEAARLLGETLEASRVGYGRLDLDADTVLIGREWTAPGVEPRPGPLALRTLGSFADDLAREDDVVIADVRTDRRTRDHLPALERRQIGAMFVTPLVERGRLVEMLYVLDRSPRTWTDGDAELVRDVAGRARVAIERLLTAQALRESELKLREANENLEETVLARTRELMAAEAALRQAQKMEAVGQLTGGIAHDFNNLLGGVSAALQVLQARLKQGKVDGAERYLAMGHESVRRAAALTQRLLAFARRQTLDPKAIDLHRLVHGMEELIRRSVGPDVELVVHDGAALWPTRTDPSQLENSLLNLCINARDAMLPGGGRLTITTANQSVDEARAAALGLSPGDYVSLGVADTGAGMPPDVIKRIFDPFFTTKPLGQGTGLGLSMVYGFVRQSGGHVEVRSTPGAGTTMCLFLPRHLGDVDEEAPEAAPQPSDVGHGETVLLIEDEQTLRSLMAEVLETQGFRVITAMDGPAGLQVLQSTRRIDLLVTDVGLPGGLNGRQVADAGRVLRPDLKVLFVTGYAEHAAFESGQVQPGMAIIHKPFEIATLAEKVREMTRAAD